MNGWWQRLFRSPEPPESTRPELETAKRKHQSVIANADRVLADYRRQDQIVPPRHR